VTTRIITDGKWSGTLEVVKASSEAVEEKIGNAFSSSQVTLSINDDDVDLFFDSNLVRDSTINITKKNSHAIVYSIEYSKSGGNDWEQSISMNLALESGGSLRVLYSVTADNFGYPDSDSFRRWFAVASGVLEPL